MELTKKHLEIMEQIKDGATIWGYSEAMILREVQNYDSSFIKFLNIKELEIITGKKFNIYSRPYFGAILTDKGKKYLKEFKMVFDAS